jgi:Arc/MetJ-type ribon-helix-helix transcriptional regulator
VECREQIAEVGLAGGQRADCRDKEGCVSDIYAIMSDMAMNRITIRIPEHLGKQLKKRADLKGQSESEIVREALENYLKKGPGETAYDMAKRLGVIGRFKGLPKDLSTNPRYFEGFGKDR